MKTGRVLIVDSDHDSRTVYRIMLQHHGFEVHEAEDGEAALEAVRALSFHVIVMELRLRSLDGHGLLTTLKSDPATAHICVVVLTAQALREDRERAERAGCSVFLTKPIEPNMLLKEIRALTAAIE